jgi:GcrA cell cycle regulator
MLVRFQAEVQFLTSEGEEMSAVGQKQMRWTDEKKALVRELWAEGRTSYEVAERLGGNITRSALMGVISRMGLKRAKGISQRKHRPSSIIRPSYYLQYGGGFMGDPTKKPEPGPRDVRTLADDPALSETVSLEDVKRNQCRFPFGETNDIHFCGRPQQPGSSYCPQHHERCWVKPRSW